MNLEEEERKTNELVVDIVTSITKSDSPSAVIAALMIVLTEMIVMDEVMTGERKYYSLMTAMAQRYEWKINELR